MGTLADEIVQGIDIAATPSDRVVSGQRIDKLADPLPPVTDAPAADPTYLALPTRPFIQFPFCSRAERPGHPAARTPQALANWADPAQMAGLDKKAPQRRHAHPNQLMARRTRWIRCLEFLKDTDR
jgi:hypothetical protein